MSKMPVQMRDPYGREVKYLRLSVTDRCNFRCNYCMAEKMEFLPRAEVLSLEELNRVCTAFIGLGVRRIRVTGGEPLVRQGLRTLFDGLHWHLQSGSLDEVTLTTNGALLDRHARMLVERGVRRVNVSLDSLDADCFAALTRTGSLPQVLRGIEVAAEAGLQLRINMVALRGINDHEIDRMLRWCGERGFDLALIESMPMGEVAGRAEHFISLQEIETGLARRWTLADTDYRTAGPARYLNVAETGTRLGLITPFSHNFCESCNRVRLTASGMLYLCLGQDDDLDLRQLLRDGADDDELRQAILDAIARKPKGHDFDESRLADGAQVVRFMSATGG